MFCALKGATLIPRREMARQSPVTINDLPASELVPATRKPATGVESRPPRLHPRAVVEVTETIVHLVRHGESTWNRERRIQGQTADIPLTALGFAQARIATDVLRGRVSGPAVLWSSDLLRARQTAQVIGDTLGIAARFDRDLREQFLGEMEGQLVRDLVPEPTPEGQHAAEVRWAGGESLHDVFIRVHGAFARILRGAPHHVLVVSHGDTLRVASALLNGRGHRDVDAEVPGNGTVTSIPLSR